MMVVVWACMCQADNKTIPKMAIALMFNFKSFIEMEFMTDFLYLLFYFEPTIPTMRDGVFTDAGTEVSCSLFYHGCQQIQWTKRAI
jgi:hypothetical protein